MKQYSIFLFFLTGFTLNASIKIACIGDSITYGLGSSRPGTGSELLDGKHYGTSYPAVLGKLLGFGYEVKNYGVSGSTALKKPKFSKDSYWRTQQFKDVTAFKPDYVIIQLGTNDARPENKKYLYAFKADLMALIENFNKQGAKKIFVCIPPPVYAESWSLVQRSLVRDIIPAIKEVAAELTVMVIDNYELFIVEEKKNKKSLFSDGVHLNEAGYAFIAQKIAHIVKNNIILDTKKGTP